MKGFIGFLFLTLSGHLHASERWVKENDPYPYIKLTSNRTGDTIILKQGEPLKILFMNRRFKGTIDSIGEHSFVMGSKEFDFELLDYISIKKSIKHVKTLKYILIGVDIGVAVSAGLCFWGYKHFSESQDYDRMFEFWKALTVFKGLLIITPILTALAFISLFIGKPQRIDLRKMWRIESVI
jgi:hypothetical protein